VKKEKDNKVLAVKLLSTLSFVVGLLGCSTDPVPAEKHPEAMIDQSRIELSESAIAANHSLQTMASIEQSKNPVQVQESLPDPASYGMGQIASIDWVGPVEPLVKKIASIAQYRLNVVGHAPAIPVLVSLDHQNMAIGEILNDALLQTRSQIDVQVYPSAQLIELRYL